MGVSGLLNLLKSIQTPVHLRRFAGQTVGIDAYGWLHRGAVSCAVDLAMGRASTKHVEFAMHRVRMLIHFGVIPYLVFDGDRLPSKGATEIEREERRNQSKAKGIELLRLGKTAPAHQELQKAVDITPDVAGQLIEELRRNNIKYVVAPYEADSQLAYLESEGFIDAILSEDSDLLVFGAKTLLTKLDQYGECVMIRQADYTACREVNLTGWTCAELRRMAILSGCDYLDGVHKMGLKTAYRLVRKCKTIERVVQCAQLEGKFRFPPDYLERFAQAEMTFLYQWVYCPSAQRLVNLTRPESKDQLAGITYIGEYVEPEIARSIADGRLNPMTKLPIVVKWPPNYKQPSLITRRPIKADAPQDNKKIDSFFTPNATRVPLAELDPNSLTPSQSQQRLLAHNTGRSWSPVPAQSRPTSAGPPHNSHGAQQSRGIASTPHPLKRQRLCAENDNQSSNTLFNSYDERSRFFSPKTPSQGSFLTKSGRSKAKKSNIEIWSDDSVEDAMATLPAFDSFVDQPNRPAGQANSVESTISCNGQSSADEPKEEEALDEEEHPIIKNCNQAEEDSFTAGQEDWPKSFKERFALTKPLSPEEDQCRQETPVSLGNSLMPVQPSTPPSSRPRHMEMVKSIDLEAVATIEETPLGKTSSSTYSPPSTCKQGTEQVTTTSDKSESSARSYGDVAPPKGSEDLLIVPDSDAETASSDCGTDTTPTRVSPIGNIHDHRYRAERRGSGEEDEEAEIETWPRRHAALDLKRFAFGAATVNATAR